MRPRFHAAGKTALAPRARRHRDRVLPLSGHAGPTADRTTIQAETHTLPAVTTLTREECADDEDYEQLTESGRQFR
ncbi:hypothetical protein ACWFRM_21400 [Streptomyces sp. NPDC055144]